MSKRFTINGSEALEWHLAELCELVARGVRASVGESKIRGLVLGGGYGRGEGGVLKTPTGDRPYNDLEFYVFMRGGRLWNERHHNEELKKLGERLSPDAALHVEFKIDSLARLRRSSVSMFSYDLMAGHRIVIGDEKLFAGCEHHLEAEKIPAAEATRLLFNRFTGLLLSRELLAQSKLRMDEADFVGRNLAKAQMALGDAVLAVHGQYHWSCSERHARLEALGRAGKACAAQAIGPEQGSAPACGLPPRFEEIIQHHAAGVKFKLHPKRILKALDEFKADHDAICSMGCELWLWIENRRLNRSFASVADYALSLNAKCPETAGWRNYLLNVKTFGPRAGLKGLAWRYPRERLMNSLPILLWQEQPLRQPELANLQKQLETDAADWNSLVGAYKQAWPAYG